MTPHPYRAASPPPAAVAPPSWRRRLLATLARCLPCGWAWVRRARGGHWEGYAWSIVPVRRHWVVAPRCWTPDYERNGYTDTFDWSGYLLVCENHGPEVPPLPLAWSWPVRIHLACLAVQVSTWPLPRRPGVSRWWSVFAVFAVAWTLWALWSCARSAGERKVRS